jgi:hypothetical protein
MSQLQALPWLLIRIPVSQNNADLDLDQQPGVPPYQCPETDPDA